MLGRNLQALDGEMHVRADLPKSPCSNTSFGKTSEKERIHNVEGEDVPSRGAGRHMSQHQDDKPSGSRRAPIHQLLNKAETADW